jgi:hypothetical protein
MLNLRKYFEGDPSRPVHFLSVRGMGYRFVARNEAITDTPALLPSDPREDRTPPPPGL